MKRTALFLLLIITTMILVSASALADTHTVLDSGECGENVTWEVWENAEGVRTLEVSGSGAITERVNPYVEDSYIKRIIVNEGVTSICDYAFLGWCLIDVQELSLPASCKSIGEYAFYSDNIRTLTLSEGLLEIGNNAFIPHTGSPHAYCVAVIPKSVTLIGNGALDDVIPAVYPNSKALAYCQENGIDNYILLNNTGSNSHRMALLKAVAQVEDVPLRYRSLAVSVLQSMSLTNNQCDTLHDYVLEEEKKLKIAMLDNSMTTNEIIGFLQRFIAKMNDVGVQISYEIAFINGFPGVKLTATVNGKETKVDVYRTEYHTWNVKNVTPSQENGYQYVKTEEGIMITGYTGNDTALIIPSKINNLPVVSIAKVNDGFPEGITSLTIPEGVKSIGSTAFYGQYALETLTLPATLETIGNYAFSDCGITSLTIPGSVTNIGRGAFSGCSNLKTVGPIGEGSNYSFGWTNTIPEYAFTGCYNLTSVTIPNTVTNIGHDAFAWCDKLSFVSIPASVKTIGERAFSGCAITDVFFSGTKTEWNAISIEDDNDSLQRAKIHYSFIVNLILPSHLTTIESEAFASIPEGTIVFIPDTVISIADDAFDNGTIIITPSGSYAATWADTNHFEYYEQ